MVNYYLPLWTCGPWHYVTEHKARGFNILTDQTEAEETQNDFPFLTLQLFYSAHLTSNSNFIGKIWTPLQTASHFSDAFTARKVQYFPGKFKLIFYNLFHSSYRKFPFAEFLFYVWYRGKKPFRISMQPVTVSYFLSLIAFFCFVFEVLLFAAPPIKVHV